MDGYVGCSVGLFAHDGFIAHDTKYGRKDWVRNNSMDRESDKRIVLIEVHQHAVK